jgi:Cu/Ag efflux protein CusF
MKKILLTMVALASSTAMITLVHADDMGMGASTQTNGTMGGMGGSGPSTNCYSARGVVEKIAPDWQTVTIHHEAISSNMPEMTMDFAIQNTNELNGISAGDQITFTLVVANNNEWIENIKPTGQKAPVMTNSAPSMDMSQTNR